MLGLPASSGHCLISGSHWFIRQLCVGRSALSSQLTSTLVTNRCLIWRPAKVAWIAMLIVFSSASTQEINSHWIWSCQQNITVRTRKEKTCSTYQTNITPRVRDKQEWHFRSWEIIMNKMPADQRLRSIIEISQTSKSPTNYWMTIHIGILKKNFHNDRFDLQVILMSQLSDPKTPWKIISTPVWLLIEFQTIWAYM